MNDWLYFHDSLICSTLTSADWAERYDHVNKLSFFFSDFKSCQVCAGISHKIESTESKSASFEFQPHRYLRVICDRKAYSKQLPKQLQPFLFPLSYNPLPIFSMNQWITWCLPCLKTLRKKGISLWFGRLLIGSKQKDGDTPPCSDQVAKFPLSEKTELCPSQIRNQ